MNLRAPVTLLDVAQRAGVSVATASRVLNGGDRVPRPELQERVKAAAEELGYTPNAQAQALAKSSTNVVGILVHDIEDPYFAAIANGVMRAADERNLLVMMASTFRDAEREIAYLASLRAQRARAAVMIGSRRTDAESLNRTASEVASFLNSGAGLALVSQSGMPAHTIEPDNRAGAAELARSLAGLGWRKFAVLGGPEALATARDRRDGFLAGLADSGLQPVAVETGDFTRDGGYLAAEQLLDRGVDVDCLFAVNDVMAVGAMSALRARGVDVPGQLGVAGFDDIATLRDVWPGLTTVRLPLEQMGRRALELAIEGGEPTTETFKAEVVLRESTARVAG
ncbi:LacI family DNA-binding transcriptional regulator [Kribbella sp. NPDC020789]